LPHRTDDRKRPHLAHLGGLGDDGRRKPGGNASRRKYAEEGKVDIEACVVLQPQEDFADAREPINAG
jgi:hypothetical protein